MKNRDGLCPTSSRSTSLREKLTKVVASATDTEGKKEREREREGGREGRREEGRETAGTDPFHLFQLCIPY